jgi:type IV pilus assembly protein PilX
MSTYALPSRERGISLVVVMLFLVIMAGIGAAAMRSAIIEEKMSGNERDRQIAFEAAEAALRDGEREVLMLLNSTSGFDSACTAGLCVPSSTATPQWNVVNWAGGIPHNYGSVTGVGAYPVTTVARTPRYIIELLPDMPPLPGCSSVTAARASCTGGTPYRVTAVGWGRRQATQVMLQSVYDKP